METNDTTETTNLTAFNRAYAYVTSNKIIVDFVAMEAREKVAEDIRRVTGSGTTEKAVSLLIASGKDKTIGKRFDDYLAAGTAAAVMLRIEAQA